jgi:SAM-dependent methyltransferase
MMFGFRDKFTYLECAKCGCVQLQDIPADLGKYYPENYYSFQTHGFLKTLLRRQWASYALGGINPIGWLVTRKFAPYDSALPIREAKVPKSARILDVGCGSGLLIQDLWYHGFKHVSGADPFLQHDLAYPNGPTVFKKELSDFKDQFDVIMLHHSFEHMDHPAQVMRDLARLLAPDGLVIIRIPFASSFAWKHYGINWMHMDPPRHLYLHTHASIDLLSAQAGLKVESVRYEGNESQFWGSEQYLKDMPLRDARSYATNRRKSMFSSEQIKEFKARAAENNRRQEGDMVCIYLRKKK